MFELYGSVGEGEGNDEGEAEAGCWIIEFSLGFLLRIFSFSMSVGAGGCVLRRRRLNMT